MWWKRGVKESEKVKMPEDWHDHAGWDAHYRSRLARRTCDPLDDDTGSIRPDRLPQLVSELKERGGRDVWVPGCGLSPLARLLAHMGLQVVATDVSRVAIEFQQGGWSEFAHLTDGLGSADPAGSFTAELHDFRTDFRREAFDLIINVKAFQGFPGQDMKRIARVHAAALRTGRHAFFDTMNVQGELRDQLEQALEDGGLSVPFLELDKWYRRTLRETGIPHNIILDQPMVPFDHYPGGRAKWDQDMDRLRAITAEYRTRVQAEQEAEQRRIGPDGKVAHVIYSTG